MQPAETPFYVLFRGPSAFPLGNRAGGSQEGPVLELFEYLRMLLPRSQQPTAQSTLFEPSFARAQWQYEGVLRKHHFLGAKNTPRARFARSPSMNMLRTCSPQPLFVHHPTFPLENGALAPFQC